MFKLALCFVEIQLAGGPKVSVAKNSSTWLCAAYYPIEVI
jgi:hypothetical protein